MISSYVLDASALIALFEDEPESHSVRRLLVLARKGRCALAMTSVNWGEVHHFVLRKLADGAADLIASLRRLPISFIVTDVELADQAARFRSKYKLPYVDGFAAALGASTGATVVTRDADFKLVEATIKVMWIQ